MLLQAVYALMYGDLLMMCLYRTRPYEVEPGKRERAVRPVDGHLQGTAASRREARGVQAHGARHRGGLRHAAAAGEGTKPRVGVVGEILVKFHPTANNQIVDVIEREGCEAVVPGLIEFFLFGIAGGIFQRQLGKTKKSEVGSRIALWVIDKFRAPVTRALRASSRFEPPANIYELAEYASEILSLCNSMGEGWLLTAEMVELIKRARPTWCARSRSRACRTTWWARPSSRSCVGATPRATSWPWTTIPARPR